MGIQPPLRHFGQFLRGHLESVTVQGTERLWARTNDDCLLPVRLKTERTTPGVRPLVGRSKSLLRCFAIGRADAHSYGQRQR
jgi:hypothetical protein